MPDPIRPCGHDNWPPCPPVPAKTVKAVLDWHKSLSAEHKAVVESDAWHEAIAAAEAPTRRVPHFPAGDAGPRK